MPCTFALIESLTTPTALGLLLVAGLAVGVALGLAWSLWRLRRRVEDVAGDREHLVTEIERLESRETILNHLAAIGETFARTNRLKPVLDATLDGVREIGGSEQVLLQYMPGEGDRMCLQVEQTDGARVVLPDELVEDVATGGRKLLVPRLEVEPRYADLLEAGFHSVVAAPIPGMYRDDTERFIGVVVALDTEQAAFNTRHLENLAAFAHHAGSVIEAARLHEHSTELSIRDGLTGLFNRQHFMKMLGHEVSRSGRSMTQFSVALADLDGFRSVNERFGHDMGNAVLKNLSETLATALRSTDVVARYGGGAFAMLLPETDGPGGKQVAENLLKRLKETVYRTPEGETFQVTATLSVATYFVDGQNAGELVTEAERVLELGKVQGKNRVVCAFEQAGSRAE